MGHGSPTGAVRSAHGDSCFAGYRDPTIEPWVDDQTGVTDDDRNRYGLLLDRAAERGLLSAHDYQSRLGELAAATSIDQMTMIVSDLPAFTVPPCLPPGDVRPSRRSTVASASGVTLAAPGGRRRSSPWLLPRCRGLRGAGVDRRLLPLRRAPGPQPGRGRRSPGRRSARAVSALRL